jgi:membrane associated rhomboid family serine protease
MISNPVRILIGVTVLSLLAIADLYKHGPQATRWREYTFLILCVAVAMLYGIVNDQITSRISWEYFYYGKDLAPIIGPDTPPNPNSLEWQAARIGAAATWWPGLVIGVAMLTANNPSPRRRQLSYARLIARLPRIMAIVALTATVIGIAGHYYLLNWISQDFRDLATADMWHPRRFMTTYGVHLGGYLGGVVAVVCSVVGIRKERSKSVIDPSGTINNIHAG